MTTTTNYGYTVVVGSDTPVNIQNDIAPNFTAIDTDLKAVSDSAITVATHTYSGGVHNLVRADADRDVMYFVATGDMATGDTFTVDGVSVTARLVNGEALKTGSFVINNNVFAILVGSVLNIYAVNPAVNNASGVSYDNTGSGMTATNVQDAIDELKNDIPSSLSATAITYNNTVSGLSATDVQYAIDEVNAKVSSSTLGTVYELVLNIDYTAPSDGYITIGCTNNSASYAQATINGVLAMYIYGTTQGYQSQSCFVRKGMTLKMIGSNNGWVRFYPFT